MIKHILFFMLLVLLVLPAFAQEETALGNDVEVYPLAPSVWRHVTYQAMAGWGRVPANGLIVINAGHAAMIDTPWTPEQTRVLLDWVEKELKANVETVIVGHSHVYCLGGLPEIHRRGILSIGLGKTREKALVAKVEGPKETFTQMRKLMVGKLGLELFYPGPGHTVDNIVVWIADEKVLFGGCFVKSADAKNLGNTAESDLAAWPTSLARLKERFPAAEVIVPGHGDPGGWELVENTLKLLAEKSK